MGQSPEEPGNSHNGDMKLLIMSFALVGVLAAGELKLGKPLTLKESVSVSAVYAKPAEFVGKTVQVKGKITEVCQAMGCWMNLTSEDGKMIRIKVEDGELEFPKDSAGKMAVAEGKLSKTEMSKAQVMAQARHEAEEGNRKFDPESVKGGKTVYQIQGTGAVISE